MEAFFAVLIVLGAAAVLPVVIFRRLAAMRRRLDFLEWEIERLRNPVAVRAAEPSRPELVPEVAAESRPGLFVPPVWVPDAARAGEPPLAESPPVAPPATMEPEQIPVAPMPAPASSVLPQALPEPRRTPEVAAEAVPVSSAPSSEPREPRPAPFDAARLEQLVGGVWLQNLGAVLLLLGGFLMIVWGYSTGRFGPQVLVGAGVVLGLTLMWRGDRVARRTPPFGHALVGVGVGVVYLTLYLGYSLLHVMNAGTALVLLVLVSFGAIVAGLRYRVQAIAAFGVIGAFLPQFMGQWLHVPGSTVSPAFLLGYMAAIDLVVFALAARAGWNALDLTAIVLSALTWLSAFHGPQWGWGIEIGLAGLFTVLGLAPLPRLVAVEGRLRPSDLAVVAVAPLALLAASAPFLSWAGRVPVAMLLLALAAIMLAAALWVDSRRPERDLWVPLTAASTIFLTAGVERAIGPVYTALAWAVEGVVLLLLGLRPRGGWLRAMGHAVTALGAVMLFGRLGSPAWVRAEWPVFNGAALRDLLCVAALLIAAARLERGRSHLLALERRAPGVWTAIGHLLLAAWLANQAQHLAAALVESGGRFNSMPPPVGIAVGARRDALAAGFSAVAWLLQAAMLGWRGSRTTVERRLCSLGLGLIALLRLCLQWNNGWWTDLRPYLHPSALLELVAVAIMAVLAVRAAADRDRLPAAERHTSEAWATAASLVLMMWGVREGWHMALVLTRPDALPGVQVTAALLRRELALTSALAAVAWLVQGGGLLLAGLRARNTWLRVMSQLVLLAGAVALTGGLDAPGWSRDQLPVVYGAALRDLLCIAVLLAAARGLAGKGEQLGSFERHAPEAWTLVGHAFLAVWLANQAGHVATVLAEGGGRFHPAPPPAGIAAAERSAALSAVLSSVAWLAQSAALSWRRPHGPWPIRLGAAGLACFALLTLVFRSDGGWWTDLPPFLHAISLLDLAAVAVLVAVAMRHADNRDRLPGLERRAPEAWATAASAMLMLWSVREMRHLAQWLTRPDALFGAPVSLDLVRRERALAAAFASVAWLVQAVVVLILGWRRDSAFLRWSGLVLLGVTVLKFLIMDLQTVDVFWRFLTAIAFGAAMLGFSYAYQRRSRTR